MASVFKKGKTWMYRASYLDGHGKRHQPTKGGFRTKALATAAAIEVEHDKHTGVNLGESNITLLDYYDQWIATYKVGKHSQITESRYPTIRRAIDEYFGQTVLKDINRTKWQAFINAYAAGTVTPRNPKHPKPRSKDTVSKLNGYIKAMLNDAIADRIININFAAHVVNPGTKPQDAELKFLEMDEYHALLDYCLEHATLRSMYQYVIVAAIMTGCRASELIALQWSDIDFDKHIVHITKSWDYVYTHDFKATKTPSSVRDIDVPVRLLDVLQKLHNEQRAANLRTGYRDDKDMVFRNVKHEIPGDAALNHGLKRAEDKLGFASPVSFHGLRHTHVSYLLAKHCDIAYISHRLGHSDITITLRVYQHLLKAYQTEQAEMAVDALNVL